MVLETENVFGCHDTEKMRGAQNAGNIYETKAIKTLVRRDL
jgi:hypothetical protein